MVAPSLTANSLNFRDVGGLRTDSGARTRSGRVFRSGTLTAAEVVELAALTDLPRLRLVVDLRSPIASPFHRPPWASGLPRVRFHRCPLVDPAEKDGETMTEIYLRLLSTNGADIACVISLLADGLPRGSTIVHCTLGKDRTGIVTALLLALLGVSRDEIVGDYAQSDPNVPEVIRRLRQADSGTSVGRLTAAGVYRARPETMRGFLEELDLRWGGAEGWALGHGVEPRVVERLRAQLLED